MTGDDLAATLARLHWTQRTLAQELRLNDRTIRLWLQAGGIPRPVAEWLGRLVAAHDRNPAPQIGTGERGRPKGGSLAGNRRKRRPSRVGDLAAPEG
jgi:hypothetical protein